MASEKTGLRLGTTIFSFNNEFHQRKFTVEQLIDKVAELDLGPGVEILGFSHIRGYPEVSEDFVRMFRNALDRNNLEPSCLSMNADINIRRDRPMTIDENYEYHKTQIETAAKLGFPVAKTQVMAGPEVLLRLLPLAEKLKIKIGVEVHSPEAADSPGVMAFREMYEKAGSPNLGFVPDFGACVTGVPKCFVEHFRELNISEEFIKIAIDTWSLSGTFGERIAQYQIREKEAGANQAEIGAMFMIFAMLGRQDPRKWLDIMPHVIHVHGKFYDALEPAVPFDELLPLFRDNGYNGFLSSEWEGNAFNEDEATPQLVALHARMRRILAGKMPPTN